RDFLARGAELYQVAPIRHLSLWNAQPVMAELMASPLLRRLASLAFRARAGSKLGDEGAEVLARPTQLPKRRRLELGCTGSTRRVIPVATLRRPSESTRGRLRGSRGPPGCRRLARNSKPSTGTSRGCMRPRC